MSLFFAWEQAKFMFGGNSSNFKSIFSCIFELFNVQFDARLQSLCQICVL